KADAEHSVARRARPRPRSWRRDAARRACSVGEQARRARTPALPPLRQPRAEGHVVAYGDRLPPDDPAEQHVRAGLRTLDAAELPVGEGAGATASTSHTAGIRAPFETAATPSRP